MSISDADIQRLAADTDLVALIQSRGVPLKPQGRDWTGRCPFHDDSESRPNLVVTPATGLWRCTDSRCGRTGNAIRFLEAFDGLSFRHAFELLAHGGTAAFESPPDGPRKQSTVPRLPCPLDPTAPDPVLLEQVAAYYATRLAAPENRAAREFLNSHGLGDEALWKRFGIGCSDRTLGLRIPAKNRLQGAGMRERLQVLGVYRSNGREHFNGCVTIPIRDSGGRLTQLYGRRTDPKAPRDAHHLHLPKLLAGIFNPAALANREIIVAASMIDALTFISHGAEAGLALMEATTCACGPPGLTDELFEAIRAARIESVRLAFPANEAGEVAVTQAAARLHAVGIECHRIRFPWGMDANQFAVETGYQATVQAVRNAEWLDPSDRNRGGTATLIPEAPSHPYPPVQSSGVPTSPPSSVVTATAHPPVDSAAEANPLPPCGTGLQTFGPPTTGSASESGSPAVFHPAIPISEKSGDAWQFTLGDRLYRITGFDKNPSPEALKITLRLTAPDGIFHLDALDLCRDSERRRFIERASEETALTKDLLKRDLGRLLLALETIRDQRHAASAIESTRKASVIPAPAARAAALELLRAPDLLDRVTAALGAAGVVGESSNQLAAYLACTSRFMDKPLGVLIQSTSAAGKSTLMDSVLAFFPPECRVKYSAMTGQSLYYLAEGNLQHKILAIVEEQGARKAGYALKLLQSEQELTIASTGKDPRSGRMETQQYRVEGPVAILITTTTADLDEELANRCLILSVDESREQTERIHALQREARTLEGLRLRKQRRETVELLQNAQRLLEPVAVVNPYAGQLRFTADRTRTRRDHEKYLTLIDTITLLHQHQRPLQHDPIAGPHIRATLGDIAAANRLAPEILRCGLDELPPQTRHLLEAAKALVRAMLDQGEPDQRECHFTRRDLREATGWGEFRVRTHLERLEQFECARRCGGRNGTVMRYALLDDARQPAAGWQAGLSDVVELGNEPSEP
jgi:hypothetical protein